MGATVRPTRVNRLAVELMVEVPVVPLVLEKEAPVERAARRWITPTTPVVAGRVLARVVETLQPTWVAMAGRGLSPASRAPLSRMAVVGVVASMTIRGAAERAVSEEAVPVIPVHQQLLDALDHPAPTVSEVAEVAEGPSIQSQVRAVTAAMVLSSSGTTRTGCH